MGMDHLYIVSYDISDQRRWRRLFKAMHGYGEWLQLSIFQCRLGKMRILELEDRIRQIINQREDHVLILDLGPAETVKPHVRSIGKSFEPVKREPVIV